MKVQTVMKTILAVVACMAFQFQASAATINEIRIDQGGADNDEYFEIAGTPGESLDDLFYIVIGDGSGGSGAVESITDLAGLFIPADGFFLAAEGTYTQGGSVDLTTSINFENSDNVTHLLVSEFSGALGDDLDTDDDGVLDVTPWSGIIDSVALVESVGSGDQIYSTTTVGPNGSFVPAHVYRIPDGTGPFLIGNFGDFDLDTSGTTNQVPEPTSIVSLMILGLGLLGLRKKLG